MRTQTSGKNSDSYENLEWEALVLACKGIEEISAKRFADLMTSNHVHLGELVEQAIRHDLVPLLGYALEQYGGFPQTNRRFAQFMRHVYDVNLQKNAVLTKEAVRILERFGEKDVLAVCTKGIVFQFMLYEDPGMRSMGDIDIMIMPEDRTKAAEILKELEYDIGQFDWQSRSISPLPRQDQIMYRLNPDHLPHHVRLSQQPGLPCFWIDIANSLTWTKSRWHVPMEEAIANPTFVKVPADISGKARHLPALSPQYAFLFAVLHLFREGWFQRTASSLLRLAQFCDIYRFWAKEKVLLRAQLPNLIARYDLTGPMTWVCGHTDELFRSNILRDLNLDGLAKTEWLQSGRGIDGSDLMWKGIMSERLQSKRDVQFVPGSFDVPSL